VASVGVGAGSVGAGSVGVDSVGAGSAGVSVGVSVVDDWSPGSVVLSGGTVSSAMAGDDSANVVARSAAAVTAAHTMARVNGQ
jgi:hypothetical protein